MSLLINKAIYAILSGTTGLTQSVPSEKMFPIAADDDVKNPFIVYERIGINTTYTKDGHAYDECKVQIIIVDDTYSSTIDVADKVRTALESISGTFAGVQIFQCLIEDAKENFGVDNYIQILTFKIITKK